MQIAAELQNADRSTVIRRSDAGALRGRFEDGICRFLGVPYAAPPVGADRFKVPQPVTPWDGERIAAARKLVDENWHEKLTLCDIARRCGLNRSKLARGFRLLYHCSVTEALLERRLAEARSQLISTDLPVGLIGYRSGYHNNASFSRAFCRRFGVPPSNFRSRLAV